MKVIGLTGNIASGKSLISKFLKSLGAVVIDMDSIGKEIQDRNIGNVVEKIKEAFGSEFIKRGKIDRRKLGNYVFANRKELEKLNSIMIPLMTERLKEILAKEKKKGTKIIVIDAAILFEAGWDKFADEVWVVYTPKEKQLERLMRREHISRKEALIRIEAQMDIEEKMKRATFVINNSNDVDAVKEQVLKLWSRIKNST